MLKKSLFSPAQPWRAGTHLFPCGVLASFRPSTGTRPPHHSAARTNLVLLIRCTVRPRGYASGLHSLRPCWTAFLSILWEIPLVVQNLLDLTVQSCAVARPAPGSPTYNPSPRRRNPCRRHTRVHFSGHPFLTQGHRRQAAGLFVLEFCSGALYIQRTDAGSCILTSSEPLNPCQPDRDGRGFHGSLRRLGDRGGGRNRRTDG